MKNDDAIADCKTILMGLQGRKRYHSPAVYKGEAKYISGGDELSVVHCSESKESCDRLHFMLLDSDLRITNWATWCKWMILKKNLAGKNG